MMNLGSWEMMIGFPVFIMSIVNMSVSFITMELAILVFNYVRRADTKLDFLVCNLSASPTSQSASTQPPPQTLFRQE